MSIGGWPSLKMIVLNEIHCKIATFIQISSFGLIANCILIHGL